MISLHYRTLISCRIVYTVLTLCERLGLGLSLEKKSCVHLCLKTASELKSILAGTLFRTFFLFGLFPVDYSRSFFSSVAYFR